MTNPTNDTYNELAHELIKQIMRMRKCCASYKTNCMHNYTRGELGVLHLLHHAFPRSLSPSYLAQKAYVSDARVASVLRTLEAKALIKRTQAQNDKRCIEVTITQKGIDAVELKHQEIFEQLTSFFEQLTQEQAHDLVVSFTHCVDIMSCAQNPKEA